MSRVDSVRLAIEKSRSSLQGSVLASDAYFPFADGPQLALDAGAIAIIQPGGSIRDHEVVEAVDAAGAAMVFTSPPPLPPLRFAVVRAGPPGLGDLALVCVRSQRQSPRPCAIMAVQPP